MYTCTHSKRKDYGGAKKILQEIIHTSAIVFRHVKLISLFTLTNYGYIIEKSSKFFI